MRVILLDPSFGFYTSRELCSWFGYFVNITDSAPENFTRILLSLLCSQAHKVTNLGMMVRGHHTFFGMAYHSLVICGL